MMVEKTVRVEQQASVRLKAIEMLGKTRTESERLRYVVVKERNEDR